MKGPIGQDIECPVPERGAIRWPEDRRATVGTQALREGNEWEGGYRSLALPTKCSKK